MKKKTNKILLIAALVVVVLNLAIIGTGIALATRNSEPADANSTTVITLDADDDSGCITISADGDGDSTTVVTVYCDEDGKVVTVKGNGGEEE